MNQLRKSYSIYDTRCVPTVFNFLMRAASLIQWRTHFVFDGFNCSEVRPNCLQIFIVHLGIMLRWHRRKDLPVAFHALVESSMYRIR